MTRWYYGIAIALFALLISPRVVRTDQEKIENDSLLKRCEVTKDVISKCGLRDSITHIPSGQSCGFGGFNSSHFTQIKCTNGRWIEQIQGHLSIRHKRAVGDQFIQQTTTVGGMIGTAIGGPVGAVIGSAVGGLVGGLICLFVCHDKGPPPNKPPTIDCDSIDINKTYTVLNGSSSVELRYGPFKGRDPEDGPIDVKATPESPHSFTRGSNIIQFTAQDKEGFQAYCAKSFDVKVITCEQPQWPQNGYVRCEHGEVLQGQKCTFTCREGYELKGQKELTCISGVNYDYQSPTCSLLHCSKTTKIQPQHGHPYCDDNSFPYGTICLSSCDKGYGTNAMKFSKCKADKKWSGSLPPCEDKEPPSFDDCPSTIHAFADKGKDMATVTWKVPTATDNSGQTPTITMKNGQASGSLFKDISEISYIATDAKGNKSPACTFFIIVEKQYCGPPVINADFHYTCGKDGYQYGAVCELKCRGSYPLIGNDKMTCEKNATSNEMYWDWGSQEMPYCKQNKCPALTYPKNGALTCDKWMYGTQCTMQCNDHYDIPLGIGGGVTFTGLFTCSTVVGKWSPVQTVPGCTSRRVGRNHRLPGELTYKGNCNDPAVKQQIKQTFVNFMQKLQNDPGFKGVCPNKDECNVQNVEVLCGSSRKRRQAVRRISIRSANVDITLMFELTMKYQPYGNSTIDALNHAKQQFAVIQNITKKMVSQGLLDVQNARIDKSSLLYGDVDIDCGPGRFPKYSTLTCGACPAGSFLDNTSGKCVYCPKGSYKDDEDAVNCTGCPLGTSTEFEGSENSTDCKEICQPGYFSSNGLVPCTPCSMGSYATTEKATNCVRCPTNKLTKHSGSSHQTDCINFDVRIEDADVTIDMKPNTNSLQTLSVSFWCRRVSDRSTMEVSIGGPGGYMFQLNSKPNIRFARQTYSTGVDFDKNKWTHFGLVLDTTSHLHAYTGGNKMFSKNVAAKALSLNTARFNSKMGVEISGLFVTENPLTSEQMRQLSQNCDEGVANPILTISDLNETAFERRIPSICDALDDCIPDPCNGHICQNKINGYQCICSGGYTGRSCEIKPDFCIENDCANGATCLSQDQNYTCKCPPRIKGTFCEDAPVDGQWAQWNDWKACSVSCAGGLRKRYRNCTNPAPSQDGIPCNGISVETENCNTFACPTCPRRPTAYGVRMQCNDIGDATVCKATCRDGLAFTPGHTPLKEYICGRETNYTWNGHPPSCAKIKSPSSMTIHSTMNYEVFPCNNINAAKKEIYHNAKNDLQCGRNGTCEIEIEIQGCEARKRRSTGAKAIITMTIPLANGDNLKLDEFMTTKTLSPALVNLLKAVADLESSAQEMNKTGQVFRLSGVNVHLDKIHISSEVKCMPGTVRTGTFCVDCPTGTHYNQNGNCEACSFGSYQDVTGQTSCKPCPDGYSTDIVGAQTVNFCTETKEYLPWLILALLFRAFGFIVLLHKKVANEDGGDVKKSSNSSIIVITVPVVLSVAVVVGVVVAVLVRKQMRIKYRKQENVVGSHASLNMIKPSNLDSARSVFVHHK